MFLVCDFGKNYYFLNAFWLEMMLIINLYGYKNIIEINIHRTKKNGRPVLMKFSFAKASWQGLFF